MMVKSTCRAALVAGAMCGLITNSPVLAQGVPVIDSTNLAKNIEQLQQHLADAERQIEQIEQLKVQIEELTNINALLDDVLGSVTGLNDIASLYNSVGDIRSRAAKITELGGFMDSLSVGDFEGLLSNLLDGEVTMGDQRAAEAIEETLAGAGFSRDKLETLSSSDNVSDGLIASTAAANATAIAAAQMSYDEAGESIERVSGLVDEIGRVETLKESVDLNTRMAAETNYMLGQMWRLNAAQGLAAGQNGVNWAAEQAKERAFFDFTGGDK